MRQWIRSQLTYANVMVTILAFIVLGGGTAFAAYVVSSNSQIGPNTIYGHNAPSTANKNVVADSLTGADVKESTLGKVPNAANGARRIDFNHPNTDASPVTILTLDEMTLSARCLQPLLGGTNLQLYITSTVGADINFAYIDRTGALDPVPRADGIGLSPGVQTHWTGMGDFGVSRQEGQLIYHNASRVISVTFDAVANDNTGRCQVTATALPAPN